MKNRYFNNEQLKELETEMKTVQVDGDGRSIEGEFTYTVEYVRGTVLKLISDLRITQEEADKQKFRFEYTEDLVKKAHTERDEARNKLLTISGE